MNRVRALLIEDEPVLRSELREALGQLWPELEIVGEAADGFEALHAVDAYQPDILFLDIALPGIDGLELASQLGSRHHIVFVTAYNEHALAAFDHGAIDYVLKPIAMPRLAITVARLKQNLHSRPANLQGIAARVNAAPSHGQLRWIKVSRGGVIRFVTIDEICYFKADRKYTLLVTRDTEAPITIPIQTLLEDLDPEMFWQIHRGTIVNVNAIAAVQRNLRGQFEVRLKHRNESLLVSSPYAKRFRGG